VTEREQNLWAHHPHARYAELYDAEYAKQLDRIARIRSEVSASLPLPPPPASPPEESPPDQSPPDQSPPDQSPSGESPSPHWDAAPPDIAATPAPDLRHVPVAESDDHPTGASRPAAAGPTHMSRRRTSWLVAAAVIAALVGGVTAILAGRTPEAPAPTVFHVPGQPTGLVASNGRVWVAGPAAGAVWILDGASGRPAAPPLRPGGTPARVALDARFAWIADTERGALVRVPRTGAGAPRPTGVGPDVADVVVAAGAVWTASSADGTVRVLDPDGHRRVLRVGAHPIALAADARRVVVLEAGGTLVRLSARTRRADGPPIMLGGTPVDVALAGDRAWVADARAGTVRVVALGSGLVGPPVHVGGSPVAIAADAAGVYVLCRGDRTLVRLDTTGSVRSQVRLAHAPTALALDPRHVWIAAGTNEVIRVDR
jgi:hypothetical protein